MPDTRELPPGYVVTYPNRDKALSRLTKLAVIIVLLVSVVLLMAVTFGGWSKLQGGTWVSFMLAGLYLIMAVMVARWARGALPIASAFAILLLIGALIAGFGGSGTSWFERGQIGYSAPRSIFGTAGLTPDVLGVLTFIIAPVQLLLIIIAMTGFGQGWNVEVERHVDELDDGHTHHTGAVSSAPA